jgi:hypothetical protein
VACGIEDIDGTAGECDDGPISNLTIMYRGRPEQVKVCKTHLEYYHRLLRPFKINAHPAKAVRYSNDRIDAWGRMWEVREVRYWLKHFLGVEVADRARLHPEKHWARWNAAAAEDADLLDKVQSAMERSVKGTAKQLYKTGDAHMRSIVQKKVAENRAAHQPLFIAPQDEVADSTAGEVVDPQA